VKAFGLPLKIKEEKHGEDTGNRRVVKKPCGTWG
jgi:hypothetical protein